MDPTLCSSIFNFLWIFEVWVQNHSLLVDFQLPVDIWSVSPEARAWSMVFHPNLQTRRLWIPFLLRDKAVKWCTERCNPITHETLCVLCLNFMLLFAFVLFVYEPFVFVLHWFLLHQCTSSGNDNLREWTGLEFTKSQRAVENGEKWRKLVVKSSVVPQRPSR